MLLVQRFAFFQCPYLIFMPFKVISVAAQETTEPFVPLLWFVVVDFMFCMNLKA